MRQPGVREGGPPAVALSASAERALEQAAIGRRRPVLSKTSAFRLSGLDRCRKVVRRCNAAEQTSLCWRDVAEAR
jgi:hypothetical protein